MELITIKLLNFLKINSRLIFFSFLFILLNIADILLTLFALGNGLTEMNPFISRNINYIIPIKIVGITIIIAIAMVCEYKYQTKNELVLPILFYGFVVIWNISEILKSGVL